MQLEQSLIADKALNEVEESKLFYFEKLKELYEQEMMNQKMEKLLNDC